MQQQHHHHMLRATLHEKGQRVRLTIKYSKKKNCLETGGKMNMGLTCESKSKLLMRISGDLL